MDRRNTLTSKTVQCPYCGEYYSVTYDTCPFCDGAQREAEAAKQQEEKRREQSRPRSSGEGKNREQRPARKKEKSSGGFLSGLLGGGGSSSPSNSKRLTPEERRATREERAAQRKRERDRLAGIPDYDYDTESVPQKPKEEMQVREIRIDAPEDGQPIIDLAALMAQVNGQMATQSEEQPAEPAAEIPAAPEAAQDTPAVSVEKPEAPAAEQPAQSAPADTDVPVPAAPPVKPVQEQPAAPVRQEKPEPKPFRFPRLRQEDEAESLPQIVDLNEYPVPEEKPAQPVSETAAPADSQTAAPSTAAKPVSEPFVYTGGGDELDSLLAEVRSMIGESPVPDLSDRPGEYFAGEEQIAPEAVAAPADDQPYDDQPPYEEPVSDDAVNSILAEVSALLHNSSMQDLIHRIMPEEQEEQPEELPEEQPEDEIPAEPVPEEAPQETIPVETSYEESAAPADEEEELQPLPSPEEEREARRAARRKERESRNRKKLPVSPQIILSLVIILVAVGILVHAFGGKKTAEPEAEAVVEVAPDTCESFTLDQTDISINEAGVTVPLNVIFQPEGTSATLTWTSSDEAVATVDQNGVVTAVGPGYSWVAASSASGLSAGCNVNCSWEGTAAAPANADTGSAAAAPASSGPKLSSTDMTLDSSGATKLLTVENANSIVTWSSDNTSVARVATDGTVTAINKGNATITAVVDGETLVCKVRCVW